MPALAGLAASATAVGLGAFKYNRANYLFDGGLRFSRYVSGYNMACAQAGMYREDIRDLTGLTVQKVGRYHLINCVMLVGAIQLIMAGRLGVHGPSPPGWILGIYWPVTAFAFMWLVVANWLSMHATARANSGMAHMLTRTVRLPVPLPEQLDRARIYGNEFEKQRVGDMLRIPFVTPAPQDKQAVEEYISDEDIATNITEAARRRNPNKRRIPFIDRRTPAWFTDELAELHGGNMGPPPMPGITPEHFELYRGLQHEWWAHDIYCRICMFLALTHWLHGCAIYIQCHCFPELRALWPAWSCTTILVIANYALCELDILSSTRESWTLPMEKVIWTTPFITCLGMTIDYSILPAGDGWRAIVWLLSFVCYIMHILWALRLLDLATPVAQAEPTDTMPGQPWWPGEWNLPTGFVNVLYLVAPPKVLEPGQTCLQQEMKHSRAKGAEGLPQKKGAPILKEVFPWKLVRGGLLASIAIWIFIFLARFVEVFNGERQLMKQEGRVERWPSHMQPWMTPWVRNGLRHEWGHAGGADRRLAEKSGFSRSVVEQNDHVATVAESLIPKLSTISKALQQPLAPPSVKIEVEPLHASNVQWPEGFEPTLLACDSQASGSAAALEKAGTGVIYSIKDEQFSNFKFNGLEGMGATLGSIWGEHGLLVSLESGALAQCAGQPANGVWNCQMLEAKLPLGGSSLDAAVTARVPGTGQLRAALVFKGEKDITLFDYHDGLWQPVGEVQVPTQSHNQVPRFTLTAAADEVLISTEGGGVLTWKIGTQEPSALATPQVTGEAAHLAWRGVCSLGTNRILRLALRESESPSWTPQLFTSTIA